MSVTYIVTLVVIAVIAIMLFKKSGGNSNSAASDADPIDEAEVYIAYGRKAQAIEILEKAKLDYPDRKDIGKKLEELKIKA